MSDFEEDQGRLLRASINLSKSSPLPSLVELGCKNLDVYRFVGLRRRNLFYQLPDPVVDQLIVTNKNMSCRRYFPLLVKPGRRSVLVPHYPPDGQLDITGWNDNTFNVALVDVRENCAGSLERLGVRTLDASDYKACDCNTSENQKHSSSGSGQFPTRDVRVNPDLDILHDILRTQSDLKELNLSHDVTRETLSIVADTCHQLRSLSFESCCGFDADTMDQLAKGCPLLEKIESYEMKNSFVFNHTVQNFPNLVYFSPFLSPKNPPVFLRTGHPPPPAKYRPNVDYTNEKYTDSVPFPDLPLICARLPNVHSLKVNAENLDKCEFESVQKLEVDGIDGPQHISSLETLLSRCGAQIQKLKLSGEYSFNCSVFDLSKVFHHCPELIELSIRSLHFTTSCEHVVTQENVKHLRCLAIHGNSCLGPPDSVLHPIICNGVLEHFQVPTLNAGLLARLTEETREAVAESRPSPVFPKLTRMEVFRVDPGLQSMTLNQCISLVTLAPKLQGFMFAINQEICELLNKFIEKYSPS